MEQEAKGRLDRQKISDEAEAERSRRELLELQANSAAVESTGQAKAEAQGRAEAQRIEGEAAVEQARLKAQATKIEAVSTSVRQDLPGDFFVCFETRLMIAQCVVIILIWVVLL